MSGIVPTEAELKAAVVIRSGQYWHDTESIAGIIATHTRPRAEAAEATCRQWFALVQAAEREFPDLDTVTVDPSNTLLVDTVKRWVQMFQSAAEKLSGSESIIALMTDQMNWQKQRITELDAKLSTAEEKAERYRLAALEADTRIAELEWEIRLLRETRAALERERGKVEEHWQHRVSELEAKLGEYRKAGLADYHRELEAAKTRIAQLKQDCADAAEQALQSAPDYEAMHTMVREAIMQVGNDKGETCRD
jgi:chromosome segregation ATPase